MSQSFSDHRFNHLATPGYLAHEHRALNRGNTEASHPILIGSSGEAALRFLFDEENGELAFNDLEDEAKVLADLIVLRKSGADR